MRMMGFKPMLALAAASAAAVLLGQGTRTVTLHVGRGGYSSIERAIDAAPDTGAVIAIARGVYREVVKVTKPNIRLVGDSPDAAKTVIIFDKSAGTAGGTFHSATVEVRADNFSAENLTFANDFAARHPRQSWGAQAVALLVTGDRAVFRNVRILGHQDTVYAASRCGSPDAEPCAPARQYFNGCYIEGDVNFIFGDGKAVFENCEIHSRRHSVGFITAQGKHYQDQDSGFVFNHCRLTAAPGVGHVWLGRPWRAYSKVIFMNTEMGAQIEPAGWREWRPGETHSLETAFYAEYNSTGPGAHPDERDPHTVRLAAGVAARFETEPFLAGRDGWDPSAGQN